MSLPDAVIRGGVDFMCTMVHKIRNAPLTTTTPRLQRVCQLPYMCSKALFLRPQSLISVTLRDKLWCTTDHILSAIVIGVVGRG